MPTQPPKKSLCKGLMTVHSALNSATLNSKKWIWEENTWQCECVTLTPNQCVQTGPTGLLVRQGHFIWNPKGYYWKIKNVITHTIRIPIFPNHAWSMLSPYPSPSWFMRKRWSKRVLVMLRAQNCHRYSKRYGPHQATRVISFT